MNTKNMNSNLNRGMNCNLYKLNEIIHQEYEKLENKLGIYYTCHTYLNKVNIFEFINKNN